MIPTTASVHAQTSRPTTQAADLAFTPAPPDMQPISARIAELEPQMGSLDEDSRTELTVLKQALAFIQQGQQAAADLAEFDALSRAASDRIHEIEAALTQPIHKNSGV